MCLSLVLLAALDGCLLSCCWLPAAVRLTNVLLTAVLPCGSAKLTDATHAHTLSKVDVTVTWAPAT